MKKETKQSVEQEGTHGMRQKTFLELTANIEAIKCEKCKLRGKISCDDAFQSAVQWKWPLSKLYTEELF